MSLTEEAREVLETLLAKMELSGDVTAREDEERIILDITGAETGLIIGKKGSTLDSLQYLTAKIISHRLHVAGDESSRRHIVVDAEGYRDRRIENLEAMAARLSEKAKDTGRRVTVNSLTAADRRIIHMALDKVEGIRTESDGEGTSRCLYIIPEGP